MKDSTTLTPTSPNSILILGAPGTGKTFLASCLPAPYFANADNNLMGVIRRRRELKMDTPIYFDELNFTTDKADLAAIGMSATQIEALPLSTVEQVPGYVIPREWRCRRLVKCLNDALTSPKIKTIVLDSMTTINEILMDEVLRKQSLILPKKGDAVLTSFFDSTTHVLDPVLEFAHWGAFGKLMRKLLLTLKSSGKLVVFIAHTSAKDDDIGVARDYIAVPGQLKDVMSGYFEEAWLLKVILRGQSVERQLITVPTKEAQSPLGLKSAAGLPASSVLDIPALLATLNMTPPK